MASLDCSNDGREQLVFRLAFTEGGNQAFDVVGHVIERLGRRAHLGRALGLNAHRMVAPAEAIGAVGKHAQRSQVAAEYQPDELQHEKQRYKHDLQLLDELRPQPVSRRNLRHFDVERSVCHPARLDRRVALHVLDGGNFREPARRFAYFPLFVSENTSTALVSPDDIFDIRLFYLGVQQPTDRLVFTEDGLIGDQRRQEHQGLGHLPPMPGGVFGRSLDQQQVSLYAPSDQDRESHGGHQPCDDAPRGPESQQAENFHCSFVKSLTCVFL